MCDVVFPRVVLGKSGVEEVFLSLCLVNFDFSFDFSESEEDPGRGLNLGGIFASVIDLVVLLLGKVCVDTLWWWIGDEGRSRRCCCCGGDVVGCDVEVVFDV